MEKEIKIKEKIIAVGSEEDKVFCRCGEKMQPIVMSHSVQYRCPKARWYHFFLFFLSPHSLPEIFVRYK
ncbi:MAG: hypothetical protein LRZ94_00945 [Candidatus Pacebacteria bacterium]|nr:hypothetical protein [Candidatus Paceibacterota bacterium]